MKTLIALTLFLVGSLVTSKTLPLTDINLDGYSDLVYESGDTLVVQLSNSIQKNIILDSLEVTDLYFLDINRDQVADLFIKTRTNTFIVTNFIVLPYEVHLNEITDNGKVVFLNHDAQVIKSYHSPVGDITYLKTSPVKAQQNNKDQVLDIEFKVFPNPASENLFFDIDLPNDSISSIEIIDIKGSVIKTFSMPIVTNSLSISNIPSGNYILKISIDGISFNSNFLISR